MSAAALKRRALSIVICGMVCAEAAVAQPAGGGALNGTISLGARSVELRGTETKFREDINLDDGLRVFDISFDYRPEGSSSAIDDLSFNASSLGGDPYESIHLGVRKYGAYRLALDRRRSDYFYEDTILPVALASVTGSTAGDLHHFNFERVRDSAQLDIDLSPATRLSLGLERQTRTGESTTTLTLQRDLFELEKPLDEALERLRVGIQHGWERVTLIFEEELGDYTSMSEIFLPGASPGQNVTTNPAELQFFFFDQAYDYDSHNHLLRVVADPTERIDLAVLWRREDLDLDLDAAERSEGTTFGGAPFATDLAGTGSASRDLETAGIDFGVSVGNRARIVASTRSNRLRQLGLSLLGADEGSGTWGIDTDGHELGAEIAIGTATVVSAGVSSETRELAFAALEDGSGDLERHKSDRDGYFTRLRFQRGRLNLVASIEDNSIDDPFALAAPSDSRRYRAELRYAWSNGFSVQTGSRRTDVGNDASGWAADTEQANLRVAYTAERFEVSAGVSTTSIDRAIDQLVTAGALQALFAIDYSAYMRQRDLRGRWAATERLAFGGSFSSYDNGGSYPLERDDHRIFVDYAISDSYSLVTSYRDIDYAEDAYDFYDADILEIGIRLDW